MKRSAVRGKNMMRKPELRKMEEGDLLLRRRRWPEEAGIQNGVERTIYVEIGSFFGF